MTSLSEAEQEETEAVRRKGNQHTLPKYLKCIHLDTVVGKEILNYWGNRVLEHTNSNGEVLALKVSSPDGIDRSQADMMHYAATNGVLAPKVRGVYDTVTKRPIARVIVSERVPGVPLVDVWQAMHCGPFEDEEAFDNWCLGRLSGGTIQRWKWKKVLERHRRKSTGRFVLTHGDISPRNIMVDGTTITGIIDWELSGFYPEYVEYAFALGIGTGIEEWWKPVLKEVLEPCSSEIVKFTRLIEERMGSY
ncbi:aminoglycoside 3 phosphotransferase [Fusarium sp. NRRL 52700]|nr:aminoglycoside 3 phosphotransferase [Fusarium sp. NRRL 52700]